MPEGSNVAQHLLKFNQRNNAVNDNIDVLKNPRIGKIMNAWLELFIFTVKLKHREMSHRQLLDLYNILYIIEYCN